MDKGDYSPTSRPLSTMKILHALVGYLSVTSPHFHPFAFGSPLAAIDYDGPAGYVNTLQNHHTGGALMRHVLGSIVETCQTVNTKNHSDFALMKRVPGDIIIEARQDIPPPVLLVIALVLYVSLSIVWVEGDNPVRGHVEFLGEDFD